MNFKLDVFSDLFWDHVTYLWEHNETYSFAFARDAKHEAAEKEYKHTVCELFDVNQIPLLLFFCLFVFPSFFLSSWNWNMSAFTHKWSISKSHFHSFANEFYHFFLFCFAYFGNNVLLVSLITNRRVNVLFAFDKDLCFLTVLTRAVSVWETLLRVLGKILMTSTVLMRFFECHHVDKDGGKFWDFMKMFYLLFKKRFNENDEVFNGKFWF